MRNVAYISVSKQSGVVLGERDVGFLLYLFFYD